MDLESTYDSKTLNLSGLTEKLVGFNDHKDLILEGRFKEELNLSSVSASYGWKLKDSFPCKVISVNEESVLLDVVSDTERKLTEERIFPLSLFVNLEPTVGKYFKLQVFDRPNATMIQIGPGTFVTEEDFPRFDFSKFANRSVFD